MRLTDDPLPPPREWDTEWKEAVAALPMAGWVQDGKWIIPSGSWIIGIEYRPPSGDGYFEPHYPAFYIARAQVRGPSQRWFISENCHTPEDALHSLADTMRTP